MITATRRILFGTNGLFGTLGRYTFTLEHRYPINSNRAGADGKVCNKNYVMVRVG